MPVLARRPPWSATQDDLHRFSASLGAVDDGTFVRIVLDGTAARPATIIGARAAVVTRRIPTPDAHFETLLEGEARTIGWYFDLDEPSAPAHELTDLAHPGKSDRLYFSNRTVTVAPGEAVS